MQELHFIFFVSFMVAYYESVMDQCVNFWEAEVNKNAVI